MLRTSRRTFLKSTAATAAAEMLPAPSSGHPAVSEVNAFEIARRHRIVRESPTTNFFEGMLLGNGDVGVCVTVRPDGLGLHLGKSDSWDIRVSEDHEQYVLPFEELLKLWERASEEAKRQGKPDMLYLESSIDFFREYTEKVESSYQKPWPRPWPCGIVWIHWDSRKVRIARQVLDPSNGLLTLDLEYDDLRGRATEVTALCFVDWESGHVSVSTSGPAPFESVAYYANVDSETQLPPPEVEAVRAVGEGAQQVPPQSAFREFSCLQRFPATAPTEHDPYPPPSEKDRNFALWARLSGLWTAEPPEDSGASSAANKNHVLFRAKRPQPFRLDLAILTPRDRADNVAAVRRAVERRSAIPVAEIRRNSEEKWKRFWTRSAVEFEDKELEKIWYHNQYFLACCLRQGKVAPGLFGNWTSGGIGTAWHGDYHMNYNTQQVFWGVFSSNHAEQHLPYVELCEGLLPMSKKYAHQKFGLPGAFFPHSAYPVPSQAIPYPAPPWGYEVCETPWVVQSLWWHYLYTRDENLLKRVYPLLRASAQFLAAYLKKESDGKYHIVPTVSPENWGFTVDYRLNKDCIMDLALAAFALKGAAEAAKVLDADPGERAQWAEVASNLAEYPKAAGPFGEVWLDVLNAPLEHVYNVPVTLAPVFPGEQVGIGLGEEQLEIARRTARTVRLEGGNDLVYEPLIRARLGILDLGWFKREVRYCLLPNGVANDRVRQVGGRYNDSTNFDFMMRMGVWTENLSLPAVLNECLMQSYTGTIRLFPNTQGLGRARFENLRAVGAFLVSASFSGKTIANVSLLSEKAGLARIANPWGRAEVRVTRAADKQRVRLRKEKGTILFEAEPGERYRLEPVG